MAVLQKPNVDVNATNEDHMTALMLAAKNGHEGNQLVTPKFEKCIEKDNEIFATTRSKFIFMIIISRCLGNPFDGSSRQPKFTN